MRAPIEDPRPFRALIVLLALAAATPACVRVGFERQQSAMVDAAPPTVDGQSADNRTPDGDQQDAAATDGASADIPADQTLRYDDEHRDAVVGPYSVLHGDCSTGVDVSITLVGDVVGPSTTPCVEGRFIFAVTATGAAGELQVGISQQGEEDRVRLFFGDGGFNQRVRSAALGGAINAVALEPGTGKVLVGGGGLLSNGTNSSMVLRFNVDGSLDSSFAPELSLDQNGAVFSLAIDAAGRIYVGGDDMVSGAFEGVRRLVRLSPSGAFDGSFDDGAPSFDSTVLALAYDATLDALYAGGYFASHRGVALGRIARLEMSGARDAAFVVGNGFDSDVERIVLVDDQIYVAGWFYAYRGASSNKVARLARDGSLDPSFSSPCDSANFATALAADAARSTLFVGGNYFRLAVNGYSANLIRATIDGALRADFDETLATDLSGPVSDIVFEPMRGVFYVGGGFTQYGSDDVGRLAAMDATGTLDRRFLPGVGFDTRPRALAIDGTRQRIYVAGEALSYNGAASSPLVALDLSGSLLP